VISRFVLFSEKNLEQPPRGYVEYKDAIIGRLPSVFPLKRNPGRRKGESTLGLACLCRSKGAGRETSLWTSRKATWTAVVVDETRGAIPDSAQAI